MMPGKRWVSARSYSVRLVLFFGAALLLLLSGCGSVKNVQAPDAGQTKPAPIAVERQTTEGIVIGEENAATNTNTWKAIPYAKPPIGALRWRAPQPAEKRSQPLQADKFCQICPQYIDHDRNPATAQVVLGNEDCLYLNIWSPKNATGKLPVFFWIHGGGNSIQWPLLSMQDGGILANRGNMIVITFNYRLGPMGFYSHPALKTGDAAGDSGNFAILDLIAALKWVQANIKNFGGDPENVTIAGESAGGQNVFCLVSSPMANGLFHRAISQSGLIRPSTPQEGATHINGILAKLMVKDGKAADAEAAAKVLAVMSAKDIEAYMRSKTAADFLEMYPEGKALGMIYFPTAYSDGKVLPADFYAALASDKYNKVPMLMGTNKEEAKVFLRSYQPFAAWRQDGSLFKEPVKTELFDLVAKFQSDGWKVMAVDQPARIMRDNEGQPFIFTYQFMWGAGGAKNNVINPPLNIILGACHAMEIDFVFGTEKASLGAVVFNDKNKPGRVALSNAMMDYWSAFAWTGNPNKQGSSLPKWSPWSNIQGFPKTMLLDADLEKAKITMGRSELTQEMIEAALKDEPRQKEIQPFWDASPYRRR
ncbi:MAG: carboxylesterase type B [Syntrophaceae bacterium]|nr:MAG: carboxylesterase type B [Syntrophaceae bacterium]